jgi:hypothetical protein
MRNTGVFNKNYRTFFLTNITLKDKNLGIKKECDEFNYNSNYSLEDRILFKVCCLSYPILNWWIRSQQFNNFTVQQSLPDWIGMN